MVEKISPRAGLELATGTSVGQRLTTEKLEILLRKGNCSLFMQFFFLRSTLV